MSSDGYGTPSKRAKLNSGHGRPRGSQLSDQLRTPERNSPKQETSSPFGKLSSELTPEKIASNIKEQADQFSRKKNLRLSSKQTTEGVSKVADNQVATTSAAKTSKLDADINDKPMFTLEQVTQFCQRKMEEQRQRLREEYEQMLEEKFAEQYDMFLRFHLDELKKEIASKDRPSYLN